MNHRRNPFIQESDEITRPQTPDIYGDLRLAERRTRSRQWERANLPCKVMYRGVDPKLALQVRKIAGILGVPTGEVARALLEYGLMALAEGDLELMPRLNPASIRRTLFPESLDASSPHRRSTRPVRKRETEPESGWRALVTWRNFTPELKREIAALASENGLDVPQGELVTALLRFSLKAYEYGLLKLEPVEQPTSYSLFPESHDDAPNAR